MCTLERSHLEALVLGPRLQLFQDGGVHLLLERGDLLLGEQIGVALDHRGFVCRDSLDRGSADRGLGPFILQLFPARKPWRPGALSCAQPKSST